MSRLRFAFVPVALWFCATASAADAPTYVSIVSVDSESVVGELGRENETHIEVVDLATGKPTTFAKSDVETLRKDLSERAVIDRVGLPVFVARRVEKSGLDGAVAVLPVANGPGGETDATRSLESQLTEALVKRAVTTVERRRLDAISEELARQEGEAFDGEKVMEIGKRIGAGALIIGSVTSRGKLAETQLRLVRVDTGEIVFAVTYAGRDDQLAVENAEMRARKTEAMIIGKFDVVWTETRTGKRGTIVYTFEAGGVVLKDRNKIGTWSAEGDSVAIVYFDPVRGRVAIEPADRDSFAGVHSWANGDRATWIGKRVE